MKLETLQVVVVGGAVAGAASALLLARAGAHVTVLEQEPAARPVGAGIALAENGLAVLEGLGLLPSLQARGAALAGVRVVDARGRTLFTPVGHDGHAPPRLLMVRRSHLYACLQRALEHEPRISLRHGARVRVVAEDGRVEACIAGVEQTLRADLVVGADGVHSQVRAALRFGARLARTGVHYARALAPSGLARNEEAWTSAGLFGSFDVGDASYWYASLGSAPLRAAVRARDLAALARAWAPAYAPSTALLAQLGSFEQLLVHEVVRVHCARFVCGRCVLVGDAAHAMAPNLGQGANAALVDAAVLLDALRSADSLQTGLASFEQRRRAPVQRVARVAARLGRLAEQSDPIRRWLRDRVLMPLAMLPDGKRTARLVLQESPADLKTMAQR